MTGRDVLEEDPNTDAYWHGYLSEALRGLLASRANEEAAAAALAKYDRWLEAERGRLEAELGRLARLRLERDAPLV